MKKPHPTNKIASRTIMYELCLNQIFWPALQGLALKGFWLILETFIRKYMYFLEFQKYSSIQFKYILKNRPWIYEKSVRSGN